MTAMAWIQQSGSMTMVLQSLMGEESMFAMKGPAQDPATLMLIALIIATGAVIFWRTVIKFVIIGVILLLVLGVFELLQVCIS